jgi:hypothetical protein
MANALYGKGREKFLTGALDWSSHTIKAYLVDSGAYTVSIDTHEFLVSIGTGARIAGPVTLGTKTTTLGAADAADITFSAVTGTSVEAIVLIRHITDENDSPLIAYIDTATGLPITPNGGDIIVTWDNGTNKIFRV